MKFSLMTYEEAGTPVVGMLVGDRVVPAAPLLTHTGLDASSVLRLLEQWERAEPALAAAAATVTEADGEPVGGVSLLAPVLYPNAIYCAAGNYRDHSQAMNAKLHQRDDAERAKEVDPRDMGLKPYHFVLPGRSCTSGPLDPIRLPSHGDMIDWEIELAVVIGRPTKNVSVEEALDYVAGYAIGIDVSVRDRQFMTIPNLPVESLFRVDFIGMKGFANSCVIGPWIAPAAQIGDPQNLSLKLWLDNELMQDSNTSEMVFSVAEQISYLSHRVTLLPGDFLMTGTPGGVGMERDRYLRAGERIRTQIECIGEMEQVVEA